jgi:hypothetical protein
VVPEAQFVSVQRIERDAVLVEGARHGQANAEASDQQVLDTRHAIVPEGRMVASGALNSEVYQLGAAC